MDVIVICNGLGNQMSQYAFYLNKKNIAKNTRFIFDKKSRNEHNGFELEKVFGITYKEGYIEHILYFVFRILGIKKYPFFTKPLLKLLCFAGLKLINENYNYTFNSKYLEPSTGFNFYYGGWHSEKYFFNIKDQVWEAFTFKLKNTSPELNNMIEKIKATNSVAVHIRRGDFLTGINYNMFGTVCTKEYFENAIQEIEILTPKPCFFVFTNDTDWVEKHFEATNFEIVMCNKGENSWRDLYLISLCKHCINSNSSFSWWGAWLNSSPNKKVIVPSFFINNIPDVDVYPHSWIKLSNF